jgi:hypothetical protein
MMRRRVAWIAPTVFVLILVAYGVGIPPFGPTPWQARAALAESGLCNSDAPITWQNGELLIGHIRHRGCDFQVGELPTMESQGRFTYSWDISFSSPFGYWKATKRTIAVF